MARKLIAAFKKWREERRRWKYISISTTGAVQIDPRWYTESPAWEELMEYARQKRLNGSRHSRSK